MLFGRSANWQPLPGQPGRTPSPWASMSNTSCPLRDNGFTGDPSCDSYLANGWDVTVVTTDSGATLSTCLNPYNSTQQEFQRTVGTGIALCVTATFVGVSVFGFCAFVKVRLSLWCRLPTVLIGGVTSRSPRDHIEINAPCLTYPRLPSPIPSPTCRFGRDSRTWSAWPRPHQCRATPVWRRRSQRWAGMATR